MKKIQTIFAPILLGMTLLLGSCSDEPVPAPAPETEIGEGYVISSFNIDNGHYAIPEGVEKIEIALISTEGETLSYEAVYEPGEPSSRFRMYIPDSSPLADGRYVMTLRQTDGTGIGGRLLVSFASNSLVEVEMSLPAYLLDGNGTQDSPYIISDDDSFNMFNINLLDDPTFGAGLFFRQTADVRPSDQSSEAPGRGYWGANFAGNYDGGGHCINGLYYKGTGRPESDTCFGLFRELRGYATVRDVKFTGVSVSGLHSEGGVVAGRSRGFNILKGISLSGYMEGVDGGSALGGLIGHIANGFVSASDIDYGMNIDGYDRVGGLFGTVSQGCAFRVSHVRTSTMHFSVSGHNDVGGIVGETDGVFSIEDVRLEHKVSSEDDDIRIISGSGEATGGIIGRISVCCKMDLAIRNARVSCPVGHTKGTAVGGIIGETAHPLALTLSGCRVYSIVSGNARVGGIFGSADFKGTVVVEGSDDDTRVVVDDMAAKISGSTDVGGFAGFWQGVYKPQARVRINLPVNGTIRNTGGAFGCLYHSDIHAADFKIGDSSDASNEDPVMRVTGSQNVGGFAGYTEYGSLRGPDSFNYSENGQSIRVPDTARFKPVYSSVVEGHESVGGLVGSAVGTQFGALSCNATVLGNMNTGGIAGYYEIRGFVVEDCAFFGTVKADKSDNTGGIFGYFKASDSGHFQDCVNYGSVTGHNCTGGIVGLILKDRPTASVESGRTCSLRWCVNTGDISGNAHVGGCCGFAHSLKADEGYNSDHERDIEFDQCMNKGNIRATGDGGTGGIVGFSEQRMGVRHCANLGNVHCSGKAMGVGGIGGRMGRDASGAGLFNDWLNLRIEECVNRGEISCDNQDTRVGGLLGYQEEGHNCEINNSLNAGAVTSKQKHDNGGLVGYMDHVSSCKNNVNSGKVSHGNATIGDHKGSYTADYNYYLDGSGKGWPSSSISIKESDFKKQSSFSHLDFDNYWTIGANGPEPKNCQWRNY